MQNSSSYRTAKFYDNMGEYNTNVKTDKLIDLDSSPPKSSSFDPFQPLVQHEQVNNYGKSNFFGGESDHKSSSEMKSVTSTMSSMNIIRSTSLEARESLVRAQMLANEDQYTELQTYRIFVGTWNVNGQSSTDIKQHWLSYDHDPPDIYAIGFQELDLSKEAFLFSDSPRETEWLLACSQGLHPKYHYELLRLVRLVGMMLIVFVKRDHMPYVSNVHAETVGTGILGKMGNKGAVAIRFEFHNSSLCFVNSHLAAHVEEFERRNQDYMEINSRLIFNQFKPPKCIKDHDHVYWLGDLNYRLMELSTDQVKNLLAAKAFNRLLEHDQLKIQHNMKKVFDGYKEGEIRFLPTYKYDPGTDNWDSSEKNRPPAWCDRILWRGGPTKQIAYRSHNKLLISDHKPVSALFDASIKIIDPVKHRKVYEDVMKQMDKLENDYLPQVAVDKTEIHFDTVMFKESMVNYLTIANTGHIGVRFEFINKPNDTSYCKEWLRIKPYTAMIKPGDKIDIELEVYVDMNVAPRLNSGKERIEDILVLHLDGGKDFFITVSGSYRPSCFGCSIDTLVRFKIPIYEIPVDLLGKIERKEYTKEFEQPVWDIPKELFILIDNLYKYCMSSSDIFQQTGLISDFHKIRDALDSGWPEKFNASVYSIAEALLIFLGSLTQPVIPDQFYLRSLECSNNFINCKQVVNEIPKFHKNIFYYLIAFLRELLHHSNSNKLDSKIIASIFGSIVLRSPENDKKLLSQSSSYNKNAVLTNMQSIERKKAAFLYHFLVNDFDI